jgi:hypothetical protein
LTGHGREQRLGDALHGPLAARRQVLAGHVASSASTMGEVLVDALISKSFEIGFFGNPISFAGTPMAKRPRESPHVLAYRALTCREADRRRTLP